MPGRTLLIDSDIFILLAGSGLLDRTLEVLGCTRADARRLDALPAMTRRSRSLKSKFDAPTLERVRAEAATIAPIADAPSPAALELLTPVHDIDSGEAVLYALLRAQETLYLASNDKRAMHAVCSTLELKPLRDKVAGRIVCLESILSVILPADGVPETADRFAPVLHADTVLQVIFTRHNIDHPTDAMEAVRSYLESLRRDLGPDFLYTF